MNTKILIVEDDTGLHAQYKWTLADYELSYATNAATALEKLKEGPELVLLDLGLPPDPDNASEGLRVLNFISSHMPMTKVIVLTGSEQQEHAMDAVRMGAFDYLQKGRGEEQLKFAIARATRMQRIVRENHELRLRGTGDDSRIIGGSQKLRSVLRRMARVAPSLVSTLLAGESGTGKELFAQTLHDSSGRSGAFIPLNCASIPGELLESELFGHEKGAFTGAYKANKGLVRSADGGTLFLDEIGDMPLELQSKMLRFLQEKKVQPVGSSKDYEVDVRIVCATHQNLSKMVKAGAFREDLFYRLAEFTLDIPPLRERENDVVELAYYILPRARAEMGVTTQAKGFSNEAISAMLFHEWPGNVRELQNRVRTALIECESELITPGDMGISLPKGTKYTLPDWFNDQYFCDETVYEEMSLDDVTNHAGAKAILNAYRRHDGNISAAAEALGITRPTFYSRSKAYGLSIEDEN